MNGDTWWVKTTNHTNWADPDDSTTTSTSDMATRRQQPPKPEPGFCPRCGLDMDSHRFFAIRGIWATAFTQPMCPKPPVKK